MSKYVKDLVTAHLRSQLEGVEEALVVNVSGVDANANVQLRRELRSKEIHLLMVKNSLAKEVIRLAKIDEYSPFGPLGGVMDGEKLDADGLKAVSKWPSRQEQISMLVGQILGPGAQISGALLGPGKTLNSQIKKKGEGEE